ncbi:MAG: sigma 54-interacting transcriptional regulator [Deltaproteobacteria bacterium]|nr:sigma 54-interacting transcriptional regulator [Deltaproteobacteria bacterium]
METIFSQLSTDEKLIFYHFVSFPDFFSIDWFTDFPASKILTVISQLEKKHWIFPDKDHQGYYTWSSKFPRQDALAKIEPEKMSKMYQNSTRILRKELPESDENTLVICRQCLLSGLQKEDLETCLKAALIKERTHKVSSAILIYDSMLEFMESMLSRQEAVAFADIRNIFIKVIERRISLSIFHLSLKKTHRYLSKALDEAKRLNDLKLQASLELMIGQHYWMSFQHKEANLHFDRGWKIITQIEDKELYKRGLKVKGLSFMIKGQYLDAIKSYEKSLGKTESDEDDNFSLFASLILALCYVQVGMPQRGLGMSERIQNRCRKTANWPLLALALVTAGMIFLEIRQFKNCRSYFLDALEIAKKENLPTQEALAGIGLASIECQEGNYELAAENYKIILQIPKSNWFYFINMIPYIETSYLIHSKSVVQPLELTPHIEFINQLKKDQINPLLYGMIKRIQLGLPENTLSPDKKISKLLELEDSVMQMGATIELARIRIELARLFHQNHEWQKSENYAKQAYDFFQPFAPNCFPSDLQHLIPRDKINNNDKLFDLVIEMGDALTEQEDLERLLTNIITSISRLTGAERAALFIKNGEPSDLKLVASRNFVKEEIQEASFNKHLNAIHSAMISNNGAIIQNDISNQDPDDFRQVIITPLRSGKRIIGALYQDSKFFPVDTRSDNMKLLSALACQIGVSIDRAQAYDKIAQLNKRLIQEKLYYIEEKEEFRPFSEIIGKSNAVRTLHELIEKVSPTNSTALIHGETGVGKELVARAIHRESPRKEGPFIRVNCAALSDSLIDSELFGHEKGAFTGAIKSKAGRFELANQGTIFLDEISELPLPTQSRLLRIIQEKEFQRVGGTKILHSDFRLITATNKDLREEVSSNKFREDLFYRLNVFPIYVPPLRERKEDIPLLAVHFLNLFCSQNKKQSMGIPESEMKKLQNHSWPGNIRQLSNMIERAVISGDPISFPEFEGTKNNVSSHTEKCELKNIVNNLERESILDALEKTNGKVSGKDGAATLLGMSRSALIHRMRKLGIQIERKPK